MIKDKRYGKIFGKIVRESRKFCNFYHISQFYRIFRKILHIVTFITLFPVFAPYFCGMKRLFFFFLLLHTIFGAFSQNRAELWTKLNVTKTLNAKWAIGTDIQYRSQANYRISENFHICETDLVRSVRLWAFYKLPQNWTITAAPIAYFANTDILDEAAHLSHSQELRTMWGLSKSFTLAKITNKNRLMYEARFVQWNKPNAFVQHRYRLQNSFTLPIFKLHEHGKGNLFLMNEFFLKTQNAKTGFDQNRIYAAFEFQHKWIGLVSGYQHVFQQGNTAIFQKRIWLTTLNVQLP